MGSSLGNMGIVRNGMKTGNNDVFLRLWWEVNNNAMNYNAKNYEMAVSSHAKWICHIIKAENIENGMEIMIGLLIGRTGE